MTDGLVEIFRVPRARMYANTFFNSICHPSSVIVKRIKNGISAKQRHLRVLRTSSSALNDGTLGSKVWHFTRVKSYRNEPDFPSERPVWRLQTTRLEAPNPPFEASIQSEMKHRYFPFRSCLAERVRQKTGIVHQKSVNSCSIYLLVSGIFLKFAERTINK